MLEKREIKKKEKFQFIIEPYSNLNELVKNSCQIYKINKGAIETRFEVNSRTSSCGSLQLLHLFVNKYHQNMDSGLTKEERQEIFDEICEKYEDFNHIFFIDCEKGGLERFFADLGFEKVWDYGNTNTWNTVNIWCYNKLTKEEVETRRKKIEEDEDNFDYDYIDDDPW